jgi:hypothetical protein
VLAMAPVFVAGTVRLISSNTNHVFSRAASRLIATGGEGRLLVDADDSESENFERPAVDRPRRKAWQDVVLFVFLRPPSTLTVRRALSTVWPASPRLRLAYSVVIARGARAEWSRSQQVAVRKCERVGGATVMAPCVRTT